MKHIIKFISSVLTVGILMTTASGCSEYESVQIDAADEAVVTFNVEMPLTDTETRASNSDNQYPSVLQWTVYEVETDDAGAVVSRELLGDYSDNQAFASSNSNASLSMTLAKGRKYQVAFFAKNINNTVVTYKEGTMTFDYNNEMSISNNCDAYVGLSGVLTKDSASEVTISMKRKLSMVGWYCADLKEKVFSEDEEARKITYSLKINSPLYSTYNLLTDKCGEAVEGIEYNDRPLFNGKNTAEGYRYEYYNSIYFYTVCYNYVLTDAATASKTLDMELMFSHPDIEDYNITVTSNSIPVRQNYKTNIYSRFLTNNEIFGITMHRDFDDSQSNEL